ncbi:MAG: glyoxalase [Verrucomicrobia bacterium]|nr:glyoxalase [Verrucomicrobiota bacterium]
MSTKVQPIPEGFHSVTPYLSITGAADALEFYKKAFNAQERFRMPGPDGKTIGHAEIVIGNSIIMLADEFPGCGSPSPKTLSGSPVGLVVYVEDADAMFHQAVAAGATVFEPLTDKFYGDRSGSVVDPFGYKWSFMTHQEDVSPEEVARRFEALCASGEAGK